MLYFGVLIFCWACLICPAEGIICYGILGSDPLVCSGRGECTDVNQCDCEQGFSGSQCEDHGYVSELEICQAEVAHLINETANFEVDLLELVSDLEICEFLLDNCREGTNIEHLLAIMQALLETRYGRNVTRSTDAFLEKSEKGCVPPGKLSLTDSLKTLACMAVGSAVAVALLVVFVALMAISIYKAWKQRTKMLDPERFLTT